MTDEPRSEQDIHEDEQRRLLLMCDMEFGWDLDTFVALTRRVMPRLLSALAGERTRADMAEHERDELRAAMGIDEQSLADDRNDEDWLAEREQNEL